MEDLKFKTAEQVMKHTNTPDRNPNFYTNMNKGFAMAINGFRISVQWGPGNYVDREVRYGNDHDAPMQHNIWGCDTAEVLIWDEAGRFAPNGSGASLFDLVFLDHLEPLSADSKLEMDQDEIDEYNARIPILEAQLEAQGGHNDQVFGHCSSECVARMIGTLVNCGDSDPRPAIAQIYNASFNNKG